LAYFIVRSRNSAAGTTRLYHAEFHRGLGVDHVAEEDQFARPLEADDPRHHHHGTEVREAHFRLAEPGVIRSDRQVAHHREFAAAAEHVPLHRCDHRLGRRPRRHAEIEAAVQHRIPGVRIGGARSLAAVRRRTDVETSREAASLGPQHDHRRRRILVGAREGVDDLILHIGIDGIQLGRAVERDDADFVVGLVANHLFWHFEFQTFR
jgi:hypothetical protein